MADDPFDQFAKFRPLAEANPPAADLGVPPPPRELSPRMRTYLARQPRGAWLTLVAILFVLTFGGALTAPRIDAFVTPAILLVLGIVLYRRVRERRKHLHRVLTAGVAIPALVTAVRQTVYRHGLFRVGTMVRATLSVEGRTVEHRSGDGSLDGLEPRTTLRVLSHPDAPEVVVPLDSIY